MIPQGGMLSIFATVKEQAINQLRRNNTDGSYLTMTIQGCTTVRTSP